MSFSYSWSSDKKVDLDKLLSNHVEVRPLVIRRLLLVSFMVSILLVGVICRVTVGNTDPDIDLDPTPFSHTTIVAFNFTDS